MKRIAFFVEGQTEQVFMNRLTKEILGPQRTNIIQKKVKGGTSIPKQEMVRNLAISRDPWYEVLIYDCGSDNRVKSEMMDNVENLKSLGYDKIVGLRDLFPIPLDDLGRLTRGLKFMPPHLKNQVSYFNVIVAIHEVETWILAEVNHFRKIDRKLEDGRFIEKHVGFNPYKDDPEKREHPASDLDEIYKLVGRSYTKKYGATRRIINGLDYHNLLDNVSKRVDSLGEVVRLLQQMKEEARRKRR